MRLNYGWNNTYVASVGYKQHLSSTPCGNKVIFKNGYSDHFDLWRATALTWGYHHTLGRFSNDQPAGVGKKFSSECRQEWAKYGWGTGHNIRACEVKQCIVSSGCTYQGSFSGHMGPWKF